MAIGYYGKKDGDKFTYCSAVKPGETANYLFLDNTQIRIATPHLWVFGKAVSGDFQNFNDRGWKYETNTNELMAVRFCIDKYETEFQGKKREYTPTMPELALLKLIQGDSGLTDGSMMFSATINLGQSSVRPANKILESNPGDDIEIESTNLFYIENIAPFDSNLAGYALTDVDAFIESKSGKKGGFNGKAKYKTIEERLTEGAKILDCDSDFMSLYNKVKQLDSNVLMALVELLRLM